MAKLLVYDPREAKKISRCRFCTKAARVEYFLGDRHICNDCISRLKRQSPDCVELPLLHHQVLVQYQEAPDCQAIANSLKLPRTRVAVILKGLGELGLVSLPNQEAIAQGEEVGAVPSLPRIPQSRAGKRRRVERQDTQGNTHILWSRDAEILDTAQKYKGNRNYAELVAKELGISAVQVRKRLGFLREARFDVPRPCQTRRRVERQDAQGNVQNLWSRDAEILDAAQKCKGDPNYAVLIAKELGIGTIQVRKRLTFLRKAGFDVPQSRQERECPLREPSLEVPQSRRTRRRVERQDAQGNVQILWSRDAEILDTAQKYKGDLKYAELVAKELGISAVQVRKRLNFLRKAGFDVPRSYQDRDYPRRKDAEGNYRSLAWRDAQVFDASRRYMDDPDHARKIAEALGTGEKHVRDRLTYLQKLGFEIPLRISRKGRPKQVPTATDALILDKIPKYRGEQAFVTRIAIELGLSASYVSRRIAVLASAGFDVPSRSAQWRQRIGEILELSAKGKTPKEIARQLGLADVKNVAKIIRQNTPSSQLRCKSIAAKVYQFLRDRPASRPKTVCEWLKEEKRETVLWSINQLKRQGLIRSDKGALRIVREMDPALIKSHFKSHHEYSEKEQYASNQ